MGDTVRPEADGGRCRVMIECCELGEPYLVTVEARLGDDDDDDDDENVLTSNELEVILPLDVTDKKLPAEELRFNDETLYTEFIVVTKGTGELGQEEEEEEEEEEAPQKVPKKTIEKKANQPPSAKQLPTSSSSKESSTAAQTKSPPKSAQQHQQQQRKKSINLKQNTKQEEKQQLQPPLQQQQQIPQDVMPPHFPPNLSGPHAQWRPPGMPPGMPPMTGINQDLAQNEYFNPYAFPPSPFPGGSPYGPGGPMGQGWPSPFGPDPYDRRSISERYGGFGGFGPGGFGPIGFGPELGSSGFPEKTQKKKEDESKKDDKSNQHEQYHIYDKEKHDKKIINRRDMSKKRPGDNRMMALGTGDFDNRSALSVGWQDVKKFKQLKEDPAYEMGSKGRRAAPQGLKYTDDNRAIIEMDQVEDSDDDVYRHKFSAESDKSKRRQPFSKEEGLPPPSIHISQSKMSTVRVNWSFDYALDPKYVHSLSIVNCVGTKYEGAVNSDLSFENFMEADKGGKVTPAIQHCWNMAPEHTFVDIINLTPGLTYRFSVIAKYSQKDQAKPSEAEIPSKSVSYTTLGPPGAPIVRVSSIDVHQVVLDWISGDCHPEVKVTGYAILMDGQALARKFSKTQTETTLRDLKPGVTHKVHVIATTNHEVGNSAASNALIITCPAQPPSVIISEIPSERAGTAKINWINPSNHPQPITYYTIYLDEKWHGEIKAQPGVYQREYEYLIDGLIPGYYYDVAVTTHCGESKIDPEADHIYCLAISEFSNSIPITCPAPPISPKLFIENIHEKGIDVTWATPQQYGYATLSGYQLIKNGQPFGQKLGPDANSATMSELRLGEQVKLQIVALTDHSCGDGEELDEQVLKQLELLANEGEEDSGIDSSIKNNDEVKFRYVREREDPVIIIDRYSNCRAGPKLVVEFTGLVLPPINVHLEGVTGHSSLIAWEMVKQKRHHYNQPDSFQITWWKGKIPERGNIFSGSTLETTYDIPNLEPGVQYTVMVTGKKSILFGRVDPKCEKDNRDYHRIHFLIMRFFIGRT